MHLTIFNAHLYRIEMCMTETKTIKSENTEAWNRINKRSKKISTNIGPWNGGKLSNSTEVHIGSKMGDNTMDRSGR